MARRLHAAMSMLQQHLAPQRFERPLLALAQDAALDYQLAEFATGQGDLETAEHFLELATSAEQQLLLQLTAHIAD